MGILITRDFIEYKAKISVPLKIISSKNTSRNGLSQCRYIDQRNRKTRDTFECLQCHYSEMSDYVAALNIRNRVLVNEPIITPLFPVVTSPFALAGVS